MLSMGLTFRLYVSHFHGETVGSVVKQVGGSGELMCRCGAVAWST